MILEAVFVSSLLFAFSSTLNDIRMPPMIIGSPSKSIIYRNEDNITLECKGFGVPAVSYEWKRNGIQLNQTLRNISTASSDGTITIENATSPDEGFYQCLATNQYGTALSNTTYLQRVFLGSTTRNTTDALNKTVLVGKPFYIQCDRSPSFPKPVYSWVVANGTADKNPTPVKPSNRIQIAENGDLYFAYALPEDDDRFYSCVTYNPRLDVKWKGGYTQLTAIGNSTNVSSAAPTLLFSSEAQTVGFVGVNVSLRCFFSGYPEPAISWSKPRSILPIGRYTITNFRTDFALRSLTESDEGEYVCTASNDLGNSSHKLQIRIEASPRFLKANDRPVDVNVTERDSATFNCSAIGKPEPKITWFQDGKELNSKNPPRRFIFSNDLKTLTVREVCRDCVSADRKRDLMVIQCNASNAHGYAFVQGYLNVLSRTTVNIEGPTRVEVEVNEKRQVQFKCRATSDPSTPPSVRWYKVEINGKDLPVQEDPPAVTVKDGVLTIHVNPNGTYNWTSYEGKYKCVGENGYSRSEAEADIVLVQRQNPATTAVPSSPGIWRMWWIYVAFGAACLVSLFLVILIGVICVRRGRRRRQTNVGRHEMGAKRCDYVRTSDIGPFRRGYPSEGSS